MLTYQYRVYDKVDADVDWFSLIFNRTNPFVVAIQKFVHQGVRTLPGKGLNLRETSKPYNLQ